LKFHEQDKVVAKYLKRLQERASASEAM